MKTDYQTTIRHIYELFNKRDIDSIFLYMTEDVHWPNSWEGGYVNGYEEVRDYWTRQWKEVNPTVMPVSITEMSDEKVNVEVHQVVKDMKGNLLFDGTIHHVYTFENGKVKSMEIIK